MLQIFESVAAWRESWETAMEAIKAAAEAGHAFAQANLGVMYINGNGVPQDY